MALVGASAAVKDDNTTVFYAGLPGQQSSGGAGGDPGVKDACQGAKGEDGKSGLAANVQKF